jgi:hypothetical protein
VQTQLSNFLRILLMFAAMLALRVWFGIWSPFGYDKSLEGLSTAAIILLFAASIFTNRLRKDGLWLQFIGYMLISAMLDSLAAAIPPLMILVLIWVIYNIKKTLDSIRQLLPMALCSLVFYALLLPPTIVQALTSDRSGDGLVLVGYGVFSVAFAAYASRFTSRDGSFKMATMLLSLPLLALLVSSIQAGLRSVFQQSWVRTDTLVGVPQQVRAHVRGDVSVAAYTRMRPTVVTEHALVTSVSSANGGMAANAVSRIAVDDAVSSVKKDA